MINMNTKVIHKVGFQRSISGFAVAGKNNFKTALDGKLLTIGAFQ